MACTYFEIKTIGLEDQVVIGHTMEFGNILNITDWQVVQYPRGHLYMTANTSRIPGATSSTTLKYGFLGIESRPLPALDEKLGAPSAHVTVVTDGMNEKGLTVGTQSLYRSEYPMWGEQSLNQNKSLVWTPRVAGWLLGTFANVTEVEQAMLAADVVVSNLDLPRKAGFHWSIADAHGNSIVLEFQHGKPKIYRNTVGVMTNDPFFPWHVENLNSYSFLQPDLEENTSIPGISIDVGQILDGQSVVPFNMGHGFNLGGIPGDASPPSRFVKTFFQRQVALLNSPPANLDEYLVLATGLLNSVFIPLGLTGPNPKRAGFTGDHTSYATLRIPQTGFYAFRTYSDMQWQFINVSALNFEHDAQLAMRVGRFGFHDVTSDLSTTSVHGRRLRGALR
jgi:choloylglycine hydrolase